MVDHLPFAPASEPDPITRTVGGATIRIRPLTTVEDGRACVELQRRVWGWDQADVVPATLLHVVEYVGGLAAGAFDQHGTLLGFVFGISGVRDGQLAHWSHMLGVREAARNMGLGRMLKEYQRDTLAALGITRIYWSFDPLMAKNAYFNLNRLGATVVEYVPDMYGTTESPLHYGLATDRLVVCLESAGRASAPVNVPELDRLPILTAFPRLSDITISVGDRNPETALIEIPADVLDVMSRSPATAHTWRLAVRDHFQWALARGYAISGVHVSADASRCFYLVSRTSSGASDGAVASAPTRAVHVSPA
jgi:predicted GNAT superfamily acetyltransferase